MEERNFGYLGFSFQQSLIKAIIEDKKYGETIIDVLESKFFDNSSFKFIMENIKELYKNYSKIAKKFTGKPIKITKSLEKNQEFIEDLEADWFHLYTYDDCEARY